MLRKLVLFDTLRCLARQGMLYESVFFTLTWFTRSSKNEEEEEEEKK